MGHGRRRRVLIYVSGGNNEGMGHIIRSSHLANALRDRADVRVAFSLSRGDLIPDWMACERFPIEMDYLRQANPVHASVVNGFEPDVFVLDVMWPKDDWLCAPKNVLIVGAGWTITKRIAEAADLLVYQTGWKIPGCVSGPEHLMLGPAYARSEIAKTVSALISFGAGIPRGYEQAAREAFPDALVPESGEMLCGLQAHSRIHIGSTGMSTYESMAMGCVPVVVNRSTDHADTAKKMDDLGTLVNCGILASCTPETLVTVARDLLLNDDLRETMARRGRTLVDGKGLGRVADRILNV
jgi:hypothetical protein